MQEVSFSWQPLQLHIHLARKAQGPANLLLLCISPGYFAAVTHVNEVVHLLIPLKSNTQLSQIAPSSLQMLESLSAERRSSYQRFGHPLWVSKCDIGDRCACLDGLPSSVRWERRKLLLSTENKQIHTKKQHNNNTDGVCACSP